MTETTFRNGIRSSVRGLWNGSLSRGQFVDALKSTIQRNLTNAWNEGALECGIAADELSDEEVEARDAFIEGQYEYIGGYADAIRENDKISGEKLQPLFDRADLWINRYGEIRDKAKAMACADEKLEWRINARCKEHCSSCVRLNGKVKRGSYWTKTILPRSRDLECGGFRCCCSLVRTDKPLSKGRLSW